MSGLLGRRVYLDTNIFIYALNGFPDYTEFLKDLFEAMDAGKVQGVTSEFTLGELLVIPFRHGDSEEESRCRMILQARPGLELLPVTRDVLEGMARIRASNPSVRSPDALHLATGQLGGCDIFLTNDQRFQASGSLRVELLSRTRP